MTGKAADLHGTIHTPATAHTGRPAASSRLCLPVFFQPISFGNAAEPHHSFFRLGGAGRSAWKTASPAEVALADHRPRRKEIIFTSGAHTPNSRQPLMSRANREMFREKGQPQSSPKAHPSTKAVRTPCKRTLENKTAPRKVPYLARPTGMDA